MTRMVHNVIGIPEDVPWEPFLKDLMGLELFPDARQFGSPTDLVIDLFPERGSTDLYIDIQISQDLIDVMVVSLEHVEGQLSPGAYLERTCDGIRHLIRNHGSARHRDRTTRG